MTATDKIRSVLANKWVSIFIILLAIIARIIQLNFFYNVRVDGMYQVMAMENFVNGHGISVSETLPANLALPVYHPLINWPPGYSILLSPFYILTGHNYIIAGLALDILAAIALILFTRRILKLLLVPIHFVNLFTLLTGFFIYYFYFINSSDAIAISLMVIAIYFGLKLIKGDSGIGSLIGLTFCLFLSGLIKYLFIPVIIIVPLFIYVKARADKNISLKRSAVVSFLILLVSLSALLLWQKLNSGSATYISESTRGFFPGNLKNFYPAIPASFVNPDSISIVTNSSFYDIVFRLFQIAHILVLLIAFIYMVRRIVKSGFKNLDIANSFLYLSFFLAVAITAVLVVLSLRVGKEENYPGHWWTYVEEARYYGLIAVLIHILVFTIYKFKIKYPARLRYAFYFLLIMLLPETFRGILFTARRVANAGYEEYSWQYEREIQKNTDMLINRDLRRIDGEIAIVTGSNYYYYDRVGIYSHVPVLNQSKIINNPSSLKTSKPVMILALISEEDLSNYNGFITNNEVFPAGYCRGFYFYILHVKPN